MLLLIDDSRCCVCDDLALRETCADVCDVVRWPESMSSEAEEPQEGRQIKRNVALKSQKVLSVRGHEFLVLPISSTVQCAHCKQYMWFARVDVITSRRKVT